MALGKPGIGGGMGRGSSGNGGGGYQRVSTPGSRYTSTGKLIKGGMIAGAAYGANKMIQHNDDKRAKEMRKYTDGYDGSAEQRSGMTKDQYMRLMMEHGINGK